MSTAAMKNEWKKTSGAHGPGRANPVGTAMLTQARPSEAAKLAFSQARRTAPAAHRKAVFAEMAREALPLVQERIREELVAFRRQEWDQAFELTPIHWKRCLTELVEIGLTSAIQALRSDNQVGPRWRALRSQFAAHLTPMRGNQHCSGLLLWCDACVAILSNLEEAGVLPKTPLRVSSQYVRIRLIKMDSLRANLSAC